MWLWLVTLFFAVAPVHAKQSTFSVDKGSTEWAFDVRWTDGKGKAHRAQFELPADDVTKDLEVPVRFKLGEANKTVAAAVNEWGKTVEGAKVKAKAGDGGVRISVSEAKSKEKLKKTLAKAGEVRDAAMRDYVRSVGFTYSDSGAIMPNHALHAANYSNDVAPVVAALGGPTKDPRMFAAKALSFVQSIPYEKRARVRDRYRRPLSLLGRNRGDCDSKAVLYLALMRSAYPRLDLAVITIKGHAFAALGLSPEKGDHKIKIEGERWVGVEPVGPGLFAVGQLGKASKRKARRGRFEATTVSKRRRRSQEAG